MTRYTTSQNVVASADGTYDIGCWGGGAGGINTQNGAGGGGGAFSYASVAVNSGDTLVLTIPAAAGAGTNGGTVTVVRSAVTLCSANGGTGSTGGTTGGVGSTKFAGGNGGAGDSYFDGEFGQWFYAKGGGGGAAGRGGVGGTGGAGDANFGSPTDGSAGAGNTSYAGTEFDGGAGNGGAPGGGGKGAASGGKGAVELIFTASDAAPVITPAGNSYNVLENAAFSQDFDADQAVTWSLVGGTDQAKFSISGAGTLTMPAKDYEAPDDSNADRVYQVTLRATNTGGANLFTNKTVTVTLLNDTAAPTITPSTTAFTVNSGAAFSQDFNSNQAGTTWSKVGGADQALFSIDANGLLSLPAQDFSAPADSGANNVYDVTIRATGPEGVTTDKAITVTVQQAEFFPTSNSTDAVGDRAWLNLGNLYSDNEVTAGFSIGPGSGEVSYTATLAGFDLSSIPDSATILGIELVSEVNPTFGSGSVNGRLDFTLKSGASSTKSTPTFVRTDPEVVHTLGGTTDVWGLSGGNLTGSGFKSGFNVTMRCIAGASGTGRTNPGVDYVKVRIYYDTTHVLTASNVATSAPAVATATVGQAHALDTNSVSPVGGPDIGTRTLTQRHALGAASVATAAPAITTATLGQRHALSATSVATAAPSVATATVGQRHALGATNVSTAAPAIQTAALVAIVALSASSIATAAPAIGTRTLAQRHALAATSLATAAPSIGTRAIAQVHALGATSIATAAPSIQTAVLTRVVVLLANSVATFAPGIGTRTLGQAHNLAANGLSTVAPAIGPPVLTQVHALGSTSIATFAPAIGTRTIGQAHILSAGTIATASPAIATAALLQVQILAAAHIATASPAISLGVLGVIPSEQMFARPIATSDPGGWTTEVDGLDLHNSIDETVPNDADYIKSANDVLNDVARIKLGMASPTVVRDVTLRYRLRRTGSNASITQTVRLYEGGGDVVGAGTLVAGPFVHNVTAPTTFEQPVDYTAIGNAQDLYLEVEAG